MNTLQKLSLLFILLFLCTKNQNNAQAANAGAGLLPYSQTEYVVLAHNSVIADSEWNKVAQALSLRHGNAPVIGFANHPADALAQLKTLQPRYVAVVDLPVNIGYRYVIELNKLSRQADDDIYNDFLWGIITGYTPQAALKTVNHAAEPFTLQTALSTSSQIRNAKWVERYAWIDDNKKGSWGEKKSADDTPTAYDIAQYDMLDKFVALYKGYDPDLMISASHAAEANIELPFEQGMLLTQNGRILLYPSDNPDSYLYKSGKRKVFLPVGNCLIGNVDNTAGSQVIAWMNDQDVAAFYGYVVTTWFGRGGWGMLKYFITNPGRHTTAEAFFLNQKEMMHIMNGWNDKFHTISYPFANNKYTADYLGKPFQDEVAKIGYEAWTRKTAGFLHDRDVLAYYGDPAWNVRLKAIDAENDYTVTTKVENNQYIITITTDADFSYERMKGGGFIQEYVDDLPFSFFFPQRLKNPRLADGQTWKAVLDENSILVYDTNFQPNKTYTITLEIGNATTGLSDKKQDPRQDIVVKEKRVLSLSGADFTVFGVDGKQVNHHNNLSAGIYIVKTKNGSVKVHVR